MKITKLSNNFAPIRKGIYFNIDTEGTTPTNLIVEIIDSSTSEVIATQQLREVISAKVNIAPYLTKFEEHQPMQNFCTSISSAPCARYNVRVDGVESEEITVSVNCVEIEEVPTIISTMPGTRRISRGESDEVLIISEEGRNIGIEITADTGEVLNLEHRTTSGANILTISTEDFGTNIRSFDVALYCEGEKFDSLHYTVAPTTKVATRLAWISDCGTIEQYTFPLSHTAKRSANKQIIATEGGVVATRCQSKQVISLSSRYEPRATIEAIAQITSATKVWVKQGEKWDLVESVTPHLEYNLFGEPSHLSLDVCLWQKEVML